MCVSILKLMDYKAIVIGAGPAGLSASSRLVSKGLKTLLIDSTTINGQGIGGLANEWHFQCAEFEEADLEGDCEFTAWPINYSEYRKYTEIAKNILGIEINRNNSTYSNHHHLGRNEIQVEEVETVIAKQRKWEEIFASTTENPLLTITDGVVSRLNHNDQSITGVEINGTQHLLGKLTNIYLAAGCVGNTEILTNSKFTSLMNSPVFSRYLADHPMFENICLEDGNRDRFHQLFKTKKLNNKHIVTKKKYRVQINRKNLGVFEIRHFYTKRSIDNTLKRLTPIEYLKNATNKVFSTLFNRIVFRPLITKIWIQLAQEINFESQIKVSNTTAIKWQLNEKDLENYKLIVKAVDNYAINNGFSIRYLKKINSVQDLQDTSQPAFHLSGTTRMSKITNDSVVDENCRLLNINNCYILGSSTFTTPSWVNPTLSIMALSIRTVDKSQ